ncbi:MAG: hypothetical protein JSS87_03865 [Acidobacteria bacterium]|nr:hypothetical protein [Acidobacteriota bacterium]
MLIRTSTIFLTVMIAFLSLGAQTQVPVPGSAKDLPGFTTPKEPEKLSPAARIFTDKKYKIKFELPGGWDMERKDGYLSNFSHDTRNTTGDLDVRGVAAINYNPYPPTTFSGALFYYSVKPHSNALDCEAQSRVGKLKAAGSVVIDGVTFHHGKDEYGIGCTESRDDVFTTLRGNECIRFDLVINTFCQTNSGSIEISGKQLGDIQSRLAKILGSVRFDKK